MLLVVVGASAYSQVRITSDQVVTDSLSFNKTTWINGFSTDGTFASPSDKKIPSQKAISTYIAAQIAAITVGVTDTAEVMRIIGAYLDTVSFSITANYDAIGDTIFTIFNGGYGYALSFKAAHQDSLNRHTDTLQLHNDRLKILKDTAIVHNNRLKVIEAAGVGGGGGGSGTIDTTGHPLAGRIAVFTAEDKIGMLTTQTDFWGLNSLGFGLQLSSTGQVLSLLGELL